MKPKSTSFLFKVGLGVGIIGILVSCSRKKNTWLSRNFHAMTTYYNILYHGNQALNAGKEVIDHNYVDNYWAVLPIERLEDTVTITYGKMVDPSKLGKLRRPPSMAPKGKEKSQKKGKPSHKKKVSSKNSIAKAFSKFKNANKGGLQNGNHQNGFNRGRNGGNFGRGRGNNNRGMNRGRNHNANFNNSQNNNQFNNTPPVRGRTGGQNNFSNQGRGNANGLNRGRGNNSTGRGRIAGGIKGSPMSLSQGIGNQNSTVNNSRGNSNFSNYVQQNSRGFMAGNSGASSGGGGIQNSFSAEERVLQGLSSGEAFDRAEDKATKAIQRHNMIINGVEHNPQMKDAFLLLGKSRYFNQRYFPALEAFNYIIHKYDDQQFITAAQIWKEKTYMRLENYDRVKKNLTSLLQNGTDLSEKNISEASAALAQTYINTGDLQRAIAPLNTAIKTTEERAKRGRYLFIKGQLFNHLHQLDSANAAFNRVIAFKRKIPRMYRMHAFTKKLKNFDFRPTPSPAESAEIDTLKMLLTNRENRPYLDILNYRTAESYKAMDSMPKAITYYNKSLRTQTPDHRLRFRIYKTLGKYYFDRAHYKTAGAYYDSTMVNLPEGSRKYRIFRRKRLNLHDVIFYEGIAKRDDSILRLVKMNPNQRLAYFTHYTDSLKTAAIARAKKAQKEAKRTKIAGNMFGRQQSMAGGPSGGAFYFYSPNRVAAGAQAFKRIWGDRDLQDNWRTQKSHSSSSKKKKEKEKTEVDFMAAIESNPAFDPQQYMDEIPDDPAVIDSISNDRNFAYYQLGIIYNEKFSKYKLAAEKLEALLQGNPAERLILPSKYNLYKIYKKLGNTAKMKQWKQDILNNYPDSRYAKILRNPESLRNAENNPEKAYARLYKSYRTGHYKSTLKKLEKEITRFYGEDIVPKMELLKARIKGRLFGFDAYKEALNFVALTYPQSKEGKKAESIIENNLPKIKDSTFVKNAKGSYYLIYPFPADQRAAAETLQKTIDKAIAEYEYKDLSTSIDVYSPHKIFLVVHGLLSRKGAEGFGVKLKKDKDYKVKHSNFGIATKNYTVILIHKNLDDYLKEFTP